MNIDNNTNSDYNKGNFSKVTDVNMFDVLMVFVHTFTWS